MNSYILIGIVGTDEGGSDSLFVVDKLRAYNIADCCLYDFTVGEVASGAVKISGIVCLDDIKKYFDNGVPLLYSQNNCKFYIGTSRIGVGKLPVYSSDKSKSGFGNYSGDLEIENGECKYLKAILNAHCCKSDGDVDEYTTTLPVSLAIPTDGSGLLLGVGKKPYFEPRSCESIWSAYDDDLYLSTGNAINPSYYLKYLDDAYTLNGLVENGIVKVTSKGYDISQVIADGIYLINFSSFGNATIITESDCRIVYMGTTYDVDIIGDLTVVVNPNVRVLIDNSSNFNTYKEEDIKIIISRNIDMDVFINYVRCFEFDNDWTIGFECFSYSKDDYPGMLEKCKELSEIIHSNDRTHRIFSDIDYFVERLNKIGFNIELY